MLGTCDQTLGLTGLHRPGDNLSRIELTRLPEAVDILARFIAQVDDTVLPIPHPQASAR